MNAGIADAANLGWMLAAVLRGWGGPAILEAYEAERLPVTEQTSQLITEIAQRVMMHRREISAEIERPDAIGNAARTRIGRAAYELDVTQQCCGGLNFGYAYGDSPIVRHDGESPPAYRMHEFAQSTVPGCRAPHLWLNDGRSLYDALGEEFTLLRSNASEDVCSFIEAADDLGVPLSVLDVEGPDSRELYPEKLVLVRPDQHIAWRGNRVPSDPASLLAFVAGR